MIRNIATTFCRASAMAASIRFSTADCKREFSQKSTPPTVAGDPCDICRVKPEGKETFE